MAKPIYQTRNGVRVALTAREVKSFVMKERGWTSEQYNNEYDKLRNRLRAYEKFQRQSGVSVEPQSPASLLYFESRARKREGAEYQPSLERQRIEAFPSRSTGKALTERSVKRLENVYAQTTSKAFDGLINANPTAQTIARPQSIIIDPNTKERRLARPEDPQDEVFTGMLITDPVKREQALKDLANKLHARQDAAGRVQASSAIPFGQAVGSDEAIDFDIENYL